MMRAYIDTNVYISYLLNPFSNTPPSAIVTAGIAGVFTILFGAPTLRELLDKVANKPYLISRILPQDVDELLTLLHREGQYVTDVPEIIPSVSRDRSDDYLITYSIAGQADYLVSGDPDLLVLGELEGIRIVSPAEFVAILDASGDSEIR